MTWRYRYAWRNARRRAHRLAESVKFWRAKAEEHEADIGKLHLLHDEERRRWAERTDRNLLPLPAGMSPTTSRDREALSRLSDENARLRDALDAAERRAVELEKQLKGNPS